MKNNDQFLKTIGFLYVLMLLTAIHISIEYIPESAKEYRYIRGNYNGNGVVGPSDARMILRTSVGFEPQVNENDLESGETVPPTEPAPLYILYWAALELYKRVDNAKLCRCCEKVYCPSLPKYNIGTMVLGYLCQEYDNAKNPSPNYHHEYRYCGETDCITLEGDEDVRRFYDDSECPEYYKFKDPFLLLRSMRKAEW